MMQEVPTLNDLKLTQLHLRLPAITLPLIPELYLSLGLDLQSYIIDVPR